MNRGASLIASVLLGTICTASAGSSLNERVAKWEPAIQEFENADRQSPPQPGGVLFVGSSSIKLWKSLESDFPGVHPLNRGFGGSQLDEVTYFADRVIVPYNPRTIVIYAGDNDLAAGKKAERVAHDFESLVSTIRLHLPRAMIVFIAIKPSPAREHLLPEVRKANDLIKAYVDSSDQLRFADIFVPMLGKDGRPRAELFSGDRLHLNSDGYRLWRDIIMQVLKPSSQ